MNYYSRKEYLRNKAELHTALVEKDYADDIDLCVKSAIIYEASTDTSTVDSNNYSTEYDVNLDTVGEYVVKCTNSKDRVGILNFASYKNPGGQFMNGSSAQEEMICHDSILYNVLSSTRFMDKFYLPNTKRLNHALYGDNLIFIPKILFTSCNTRIDVITCAAPNFGAYARYNRVDREMYLSILESRIDHILFCAYKEGIEVLVLGAFGCGVFKNDPKDVANIMSNLLKSKYKGVFKKVIFPIPDAKNRNIFKHYIGG